MTKKLRELLYSASTLTMPGIRPLEHAHPFRPTWQVGPELDDIINSKVRDGKLVIVHIPKLGRQTEYPVDDVDELKKTLRHITDVLRLVGSGK